jgi:hypothetical protein
MGYELNFCTYTAGWTDSDMGSYHLPGMSMLLQQATEVVPKCGWFFCCKTNIHPFVSNQFAMISHCIFTTDCVSVIIIIREGRTQNRKCYCIDNHLVLELSSGNDSPSYLQHSDCQLADWHVRLLTVQRLAAGWLWPRIYQRRAVW